MEFTSLNFLGLAVMSVFVYYRLGQRLRHWLLILLSSGFIATYDVYLLIYVVFYSLVNYWFGLKIPSSKNQKVLYRFGILVNISQLVLLKYTSFAVDPFLKLIDSNYTLAGISQFIVPIGVSYFTLQGIGYLINIKMGWEKPEENISNFLLFFLFYPKFLSGPIERSNHFLPQLRQFHNFNQAEVTLGLRQILVGLFKKVVISNQLAVYIQMFYSNSGSVENIYGWLIILIQPVYLYFDFSGYTDIALGLARIYGIRLLPNFNKPFLAENMTNFWRRFHISLSSWFNDYIFKQVSFKYRKFGVLASIWAIFITWTLFGIWHGAGWNFMFLGMLQALAIIYEFFTRKWRIRLFSKMPTHLKIWMGRIFTYLFYGTSLIFFFAPDLRVALGVFPKIFIGNGFVPQGEQVSLMIFNFIIIIVFLAIEFIGNEYVNLSQRFEKIWSGSNFKNKSLRWLIYFLALTVVIVFSSKTQEFIYFQF